MKFHEMVPPFGVGWVVFCQATDPATDPNNFVGPGKMWVETDDDTAPTAVTAVHIWSVDDSAWLDWPLGASSSGGDADTLDGLDSPYFLLLSNIDATTVSKTANYTATTADYAILCDATGGTFAITLPAAASNTGRVYLIKKTDASANAVTVDGNASETIDGATTQSLGNENEAVLIVCNGTGWFIMSRPGASSSGIQNSIMDAKGDLIAASAADTPAKLTVGADGTILVAASGQATGLQWQSLSTAGIQPLDAELSAIAGLTSAADKGIQFTGSGTAATYDLTTAGKALLDDANAAAQLVTLGAAPLASPTFTGTPSLPTGTTATTQTAGDNSTKISTTAYTDNAVAKHSEALVYAISDETTALTTGTAKLTVFAPFNFTLVDVFAGLTAQSTSGAPAFDINKAGVSIFSTTLTIDANEDTSLTAATPAVITTTSFTKGDKITFDIDTAGTGAKGAKITMNVTHA